MPKFHFHAENGVFYRDEAGAELPDLKAASATAVKVLAEYLHNKPAEFWRHDCLQVHLADHDGMKLLTLTVSVVFAPALKGREHTARPQDSFDAVDQPPLR